MKAQLGLLSLPVESKHGPLLHCREDSVYFFARLFDFNLFFYFLFLANKIKVWLFAFYNAVTVSRVIQ